MTSLSTQDLEALKALAEKATPGPWEMSESGVVCSSDFDSVIWMEWVSNGNHMYDGGEAINQRKAEDAAFIAAFNPQTALALIAHITALEAEKAEARRLALEEAWDQVEHLAQAEATAENRSANYFDALSHAQSAILALKERT